MKPYPEYKASGIDWLGEIPSHWKLSKYKYHAESRMGITILRENMGETGLPIYSATQDDAILGYTHNRSLVLHKNDFVIPARGNSIGWVSKVAFEEATCSQTTICSTNFHNISVDFLFYCCKAFKSQWFFFDDTAIPQITVSQIDNNILPLPPLPEQQEIANFLDEKTGKIDALISEKTAQVEELRAYRSSLITETVTRGLNPDVTLRDSGIDWLGQIPQHWEISKSAWTFDTIGSGTTPFSGADEYYNNGTINWLQTGDLNDGIITSTSKKITLLAVNDKGLRIYPKGSLVIAMYGATIAKTGILAIDTTVNQACCVLLPSDKIINKFAFYYFNAAKTALISLASGGGQPNISQAIISNFTTILPPLPEQQEIADFLDEKTGKIDRLIEELTKQLDELAEYKQAVITEAVTGKVDVRDYKGN